MPDLEKVISALECISNGAKQPCRDCEYSKREEWCIAECAKDALALLKAQAKDETRLVRHYSRPNVYADLWLHCEKCGERVDDRWRPKHCPGCGRAVKWE